MRARPPAARSLSRVLEFNAHDDELAQQDRPTVSPASLRAGFFVAARRAPTAYRARRLQLQARFADCLKEMRLAPIRLTVKLERLSQLRQLHRLEHRREQTEAPSAFLVGPRYRDGAFFDYGGFRVGGRLSAL